MTIQELYDWAVENGCENFEANTEWNGEFLDIEPYVNYEKKYVNIG